MQEGYKEIEATIEGKSVSLFITNTPNCPIIYLNSYQNNALEVFNCLLSLSSPPFNLAILSNLDWGKDMCPWDCPPLFTGDSPCYEGATSYLTFLIDKITPFVEKSILGGASHKVIAGYSLAGLFSLYTLHNSTYFDAAISASGSLWYPNFSSYIKNSPLKKLPLFIYLSLGNREHLSKITLLKTVKERTEEAYNYYKGLGVAVKFTSNSGGHHKDAVKRTADAICYTLNKLKEIDKEKACEKGK